MSVRPVRVLVLGDIMLDDHMYHDGAPGDDCYEGGVPILRRPRHIREPGAAANVAANVVSLGGEVTLLGSVTHTYAGLGAGAHLCRALRRARVPDQWLSVTGGRMTVIHRLRRDEHLLARWDDGYPDVSVQPLVSACRLLPGYDVLCLSDYGRGVLGLRGDDTPLHSDLIRQLICAASERGIPVMVDTKRTARVQEYQGCNMLKGHTDELYAMVPEADYSGAPATWLLHRVAAQVVETRSERGMALWSRPSGLGVSATIQPCIATHPVRDPVGAGDTVLAALALRWGRVPDRDALQYAAGAAAVACSRAGTIAVTDAEVQAALTGVIIA